MGKRIKIDDDIKKIFGEPISVYLSDQAEEDGFLVKVKDSHFNYMTRRVWDECIEPFVIKDDDGKPMVIPGIDNTYRAMIKKLLGRVKQTIFNQIIDGKAKPDDWFYKVETSGWTFFVEQNETGKFTLLFPDEH